MSVSTNWQKNKYPLVKWTTVKYIVFIGIAIKVAVLVSWRTTPVFLCWSDDLQLQIQKRCCYLKNVSLDFVLLVWKLCPIQVPISLPLWIKFTRGQLLLSFLSNFSSFFSYLDSILVHCNQSFFTATDWWVYFGHSPNHNTQRAFAILFLICSDLLNCLRYYETMVIKQKVVKPAPDIISPSENINRTACVSRLSFCFLWLWPNNSLYKIKNTQK